MRDVISFLMAPIMIGGIARLQIAGFNYHDIKAQRQKEKRSKVLVSNRVLAYKS
jgi:hypothetical protein